MKKKTLSLALALVLCLSLALPAYAAETHDDFFINANNVLDCSEPGAEDALHLTCAAPVQIAFSDEVSHPLAVKIRDEDKVTVDAVHQYIFDIYIKENKAGPEVVKELEITGGKSITITEPGRYIVYAGEELGIGRTYLVDVQGNSDANPGNGNSSIRFEDVTQNDWFYDAVQWAVEKNITAGTSAAAFSPNLTCTNAQILTFLWRAQGSPAPEKPVSSDRYYAQAAEWAVQTGLLNEFEADIPCTRAMVVTYLWKLAGSPAAPGNSFSDVPAGADYAQAVAWAVEKEITAGTGDATFSPDSACTRGQIVTFLHRAFAKQAEGEQVQEGNEPQPGGVDITKINGTYVHETNSNYELQVMFSSPRIYVKLYNKKYDKVGLTANMTISLDGDFAYADTVALWFYPDCLVLMPWQPGEPAPLGPDHELKPEYDERAPHGKYILQND